MLYQKQDGKLRVIAYWNFSLLSGRLQKKSVTICITNFFTVYSDNNPLTYVLSTAKLNATGSRWVAELADFNFTIKYRPGKENIDADSLSRMPVDVEN